MNNLSVQKVSKEICAFGNKSAMIAREKIIFTPQKVCLLRMER